MLEQTAGAVAELARDVDDVLASRRALKAGVTAALTAGGDYTQAQALADALQDSVPAVRWRLRHDLGGKLIGVAWFGDEGAASKQALAELPPTHTEEIPGGTPRSGPKRPHSAAVLWVPGSCQRECYSTPEYGRDAANQGCAS